MVDSGINPARVVHRPFPSPGGALAPSVSMPDHAAKHRHFGPMSRRTIPRFARAVRRIGEDEQYRIAGAVSSAAAHAAPERGQGDTLDTYGRAKRAAGTHRYYQDFAAGRAGPRTPNASTPPTPTAPAATTAPNTCTSTRKPKRANQAAKLRYNLSGVSQRPTDLQRGPHLENAALGPPLSKPSQTLIHVQDSKSAFSTGHFHPRCRPIPSALRAAHSWIGTCFSAHASTTAATMSWMRRVSRSSTVTEPLSVRC